MKTKRTKVVRVPDLAMYTLQYTGNLIPCPGDAHKNPHIDNCTICAPAWGVIPEQKPVDLAKAQAEKLAIPMGWIVDDNLMTQAMALVDSGAAKIVEMTETRKGSTCSFCVLSWTEA